MFENKFDFSIKHTHVCMYCAKTLVRLTKSDIGVVGQKSVNLFSLWKM